MFVVRKYGAEPYTHVLIHGGPGAIGALSDLAEELSAYTGILEPLQSKYSVWELVDELHDQITEHATLPAVLIGHSWGAWLTLLYASRHPKKPKALILIGSGALEPEEDTDFDQRRIARLPENERQEYLDILDQLNDGQNNDILLMRLGELSEKADTYCPLSPPAPVQSVDSVMFHKVWSEAAEMRRTGKLLREINGIKCPVYVVHGSYDPHPVDGVINPLRKIGIDPIVILYEKCGHSPFKERFAHDDLLAMIRSTIPE